MFLSFILFYLIFQKGTGCLVFGSPCLDVMVTLVEEQMFRGDRDGVGWDSWEAALALSSGVQL